ncbi:MAG: energy transducer TonB [Longimicrobiaceae bacterium]
MQHQHLLLAISAAALAAACAPIDPSTGPTTGSGFLGADDGLVRGARCTVSLVPATLPKPEALMDADAFRAAAARLWAAAGRPAGHVLFSIRHSPDGVQVRRAVIESTVPAFLADSLQVLVFDYRRRTPRTAEEWGVRLRVELGDAPALQVERRRECAPRPREEERLAADAFDVRERDLSSVAALPVTDPGLVWVRVRLDANGRVTEATVERGVRRGAWEQRLLNYVRTMAFYPAVEDGYPVPSETTISLRLPSNS